MFFFFSSDVCMLRTLCFDEISYETTSARNYARAFARLDIREDNTDVLREYFSWKRKKNSGEYLSIRHCDI